MRRIVPPVVDDAETLRQVIAAKTEPRRGVLGAIAPRLLSSYERYTTSAPAFERLPVDEYTEIQREALLHAFAVGTAPILRLRSALTASLNVSRCPFCSVGASSTLDHYLPKENSPQFAIFSKNLVPSCGLCNSIKSNQILDRETGVRAFLHPYYDEIPTDPFVFLDVALLADAIKLKFSVAQPEGMSDDDFRRLDSHFRRLGLANRYSVMSLVHLREQRRALARFYGSDADADRVSTELMNTSRDFEQDYGANYWAAVLYRTLAGDEQFCDGGFGVLSVIQ